MHHQKGISSRQEVNNTTLRHLTKYSNENQHMNPQKRQDYSNSSNLVQYPNLLNHKCETNTVNQILPSQYEHTLNSAHHPLTLA